VGVDYSSLQADSWPKLVGWSEGQRPLSVVLYSSNELDQLLKWFMVRAQ